MFNVLHFKFKEKKTNSDIIIYFLVNENENKKVQKDEIFPKGQEQLFLFYFSFGMSHSYFVIVIHLGYLTDRI